MCGLNKQRASYRSRSTVDKMRYRYILFDLDNTLLDFDHSSRLALFKTLESNGLEPTEELYYTYREHNRQVWTEFEEGKISQDTLRTKRWQLFWQSQNMEVDLVRCNIYYLDRLVHFTKLTGEAHEVLSHIHRSNRKMGLITNGLEEVQRPRINKMGIGHFFESIVVSGEIGHAKPDREFFEHTFRELDHPAREEVLVVGDNLSSDIQGGINYGVDTFWLNHHRQDSLHIKPTYEAGSLLELLDII
jgi:YjjG family noncanonical pyrimidine nucleotidase